ncbi:MAG: hypothetical protein AAF389_02075 [Gemmatimonadota bacterium]
MADDVIDLTRYMKREPEAELPRGSMTLWGADGERSRFALPLWRIIHLARAERGMVVYASVENPRDARPFVVLDLASDPARTHVDTSLIPRFEVDEGPSLIDMDQQGLAVYLGAEDGRQWSLIVDGDISRTEPLASTAREDVLFLAGECAGLLFLRELAADAVPKPPPGDPDGLSEEP